MSNEAGSSRLVELIGSRILAGDILPGTKLTEASLAKQLGVSRAPLREALLKLEERQLIERVPFSGMRVARLTERAIEELYEIREVLEGLACRKAAALITPAEIAGLRHWLAASEGRIAALKGEDARALSTIGDLHAEIARIAGNAELAKLLGREIWTFLRVNYQILNRSGERLREAVAEHQRIVDALEARDGELAELLMRRHIVKARRGLGATLS